MIPKIFHFIFGLKEQKKEFSIIYYLALKSCLSVNNPDKINFYYKYEPYGSYWDKIKHKLNLIKVDPPTEIFGIPIKHYAHQADIIRLQALIEEGGIYADIDTIFINKYPKHLYEKDFVMGMQGNEGLCNALMMSQKDSYFAKKWLGDHNICFKGGEPGTEGWCTHSVYYPQHLANTIYSDNIHIEPPTSFFGFLYHQESLNGLFNSDIQLDSSIYSLHLWENVSWEPYLSNIDENSIINQNTTYNKIARQFL